MNPTDDSHRVRRNRWLSLLLLPLAVFACASPDEKPAEAEKPAQPKAPEPPPTNSEPVLVPPAEVPKAAQFAALGAVGAVYRLEHKSTAEVKIAIPAEALTRLLPHTIRAFRFDEQTTAWQELPETKVDPESRTMVLAAPEAGYYTAFGWSLNPADNALQRWTLDAKHGRRPDYEPAETLEALRKQVLTVASHHRHELVRDWMVWEVTLDRTTCETKDAEACADSCKALAGRKKLSSCPEECQAPACCECEEFKFIERVWVPQSLFDSGGICIAGQPGCGLCPNGLSCPTAETPPITVIAPTLETPDYSQFHGRLGDLIADEDLRDYVHSMVERTVGQEYPVPPPWP